MNKKIGKNRVGGHIKGGWNLLDRLLILGMTGGLFFALSSDRSPAESVIQTEFILNNSEQNSPCSNMDLWSWDDVQAFLSWPVQQENLSAGATIPPDSLGSQAPAFFPPPGCNLRVVNGDFNNGNAGWNTWTFMRGAQYDFASSQVPLGSLAPCLEISQTGTFIGGIYQVLSLVQGEIYTISCTARDINSTTNSSWLEILVGTTAPVNGQDYTSGKLIAWDTFLCRGWNGSSRTACVMSEESFIAASSTMYLVIRCGEWGASNRYQVSIDNLAVCGASPPGTPTPSPTASPTPLPPEITSIWPSDVAAGWRVRIEGDRFGTVPGKISFDIGKPEILDASVMSWSEKIIEATVPADICSDPTLRVHTDDGREILYNNAFRVIPPEIIYLGNTVVYNGSTLSFTGKNFGPDPGKSGVVTLDEAPTEILSWSADRITVQIPEEISLSDGFYYLHLTVGCRTVTSNNRYELRHRKSMSVHLTVNGHFETFGDPINGSVLLQPYPYPYSPTLVTLHLKHLSSGRETVKSIAYPLDTQTPFILGPDDLDRSGAWEIQARWDNRNSPEYVSAESQIAPVEIRRATSAIALSAIQQIRSGDSPRVSGIFSPIPPLQKEPLYPDLRFIGLPIILEALSPSGSVIRQATAYTTNEAGNFAYQGTRFPLVETGYWKITARYKGDNRFTPAVSGEQTCQVSGSPGYAVLVCGNDAQGSGLLGHMRTLNTVYTALIHRGLTASDIRYLTALPEQVPNRNQSFYAFPSKDSIENALIDSASDMKRSPGPLMIVLVDHGTTDEFHIAQVEPGSEQSKSYILGEEDILSAPELDEMQDRMYQQLANSEASQMPVITVIGACRSGSFMDDLIAPAESSNPHIVLTSSDSEELSFAGDCRGSGTDDCQGELFVAKLAEGIDIDLDLLSAFKFASALVKAEVHSPNVTLWNGGTHTYLDQAIQHPLLNDNRDAIGTHSSFSSFDGDDGFISRTLRIGKKSNGPGLTILGNTGDQTTPPGVIPEVTATVNLEAADMWLDLRPPDFQIPYYDPGTTLQPAIHGTIVNGRRYGYQGGFPLFHWTHEDFIHAGVTFQATGTYEIRLFAVTSEDKIATTLPILIQAAGNNIVPSAFNLIAPPIGAHVSNKAIGFTWEASHFEDKPMEYELVISSQSNLSAPVYKHSGIRDSYHIVDGEPFLIGQRYYWTIYAYASGAGRRRANDIWWFEVQPSGSVPVVFRGAALDPLTKQIIGNAQVIIQPPPLFFPTPGSNGFQFIGEPREYQVSISATDYCQTPATLIDLRTTSIQETVLFPQHPRLNVQNLTQYLNRERSVLRGAGLFKCIQYWQECGVEE